MHRGEPGDAVGSRGEQYFEKKNGKAAAKSSTSEAEENAFGDGVASEA
jgi:hypothetical protein